jgi:hypothetical protein
MQRRPGIDPPETIEGFPSRYPRHDHVQNHQLNLRPLLHINGERRLTAPGGIDTVTQEFQHFPAHLQNHLFIIHQQDRLRAPCNGPGLRLFLHHFLLRSGETDISSISSSFVLPWFVIRASYYDKPYRWKENAVIRCCRLDHHAVTPPSTGKATPFMNAASSDTR